MPAATALKPPRKAAFAPPAPGLNRLGGNVKVNTAEDKATKDEIPVITIVGDTCQRFNEAKKQIKDAEAVVKELEATIHEQAKLHIFKHNCSPGCLAKLTSVKLQDITINDEAEDETPDRIIRGEVTRVSFTSRYNNCDTAQVDAAFADFPPVPDGKGGKVHRDINEYVVETIAAKFDDSVFMDAEGNFDLVAYNKFRLAIEKVAKELGMIDAETGKVKSPLGTKRVLKVKPDFHERRFRDFNEDENFTLANVLPNTIQCAPVRTV
jgi:hypothetical protein